MTSPTELKAGDRVQVVLELRRRESHYGHWYVAVEGSDVLTDYWLHRNFVAAGTLLPPKPKPLQVGDRVRPRSNYGAAIAEIRFIDTDGFATIRWTSQSLYGPTLAHNVVPLSDLTRIEDTP